MEPPVGDSNHEALRSLVPARLERHGLPFCGPGPSPGRHLRHPGHRGPAGRLAPGDHRHRVHRPGRGRDRGPHRRRGHDLVRDRIGHRAPRGRGPGERRRGPRRRGRPRPHHRHPRRRDRGVEPGRDAGRPGVRRGLGRGDGRERHALRVAADDRVHRRGLAGPGRQHPDVAAVHWPVLDGGGLERLPGARGLQPRPARHDVPAPEHDQRGVVEPGRRDLDGGARAGHHAAALDPAGPAGVRRVRRQALDRRRPGPARPARRARVPQRRVEHLARLRLRPTSSTDAAVDSFQSTVDSKKSGGTRSSGFSAAARPRRSGRSGRPLAACSSSP
jgi:hypothetical protein